MNKVHNSLNNLLIDINRLIPLPGNPRVSDPNVIASSLKEFGQLKPIVVKQNDDGTFTILAGNHTVEAARMLGWTEIAAVAVTDMDEKKARAFALTDNRINELGSTNEHLLHESLMSIMDEYQDYLEVLGWDEFELASIDFHYTPDESSNSSGFVPPVLINRRDGADSSNSTNQTTSGQSTHGSMVEGKSEPSHIVAPSASDSRDIITRGSSAGGHSGANVVVQYTIVFDSSDHQKRWYDFLRWLRSDPSIDGETTSERLMNFLDAHANF